MNYSSLNKTSFTALGPKICAAMQHVLNTGESVRLKNRKGEGWLLITLDKHHDRGYTFRFVTADGIEVGDVVLKASVKYWSDADHIQFWAMHGEAWELDEHPLIRLVREEREREIARTTAKYATARKDHNARKLGATIKVHFWGRKEHSYGLYKRNWYGKKCLHLVNPETGKVSKVNPEVLPLIRYEERFV